MKRGICLLALAAVLLPAMCAAGTEVAPYGFILLNSSYSTRSITDIPVVAPAAGGGEPTFLMTPRQSRFGLKMKSDAAHTPGGAIEVDFWGLRGSGGSGGATQSGVRLRRAFFEMQFEKFSLLAGQEWIALAPLNPTSLMHASLPGMMASGNLWARLPQVRATMKPVVDEKKEIKIDVALTRPLGGDATMTPVEQGDVLGRGEKYGWPWLQGRVGYAMKGTTALTVGAGAHYGREDFGQDPEGEDNFGTSFAMAGDVQLVAGKVTVSGEGFMGKNIASLFSHAGYALVPDSLEVDGAWIRYHRFEGIEAVGGWGEIKYAATPAFDIAASVGVETMDDEFLKDGAVKSNMTAMLTGICKGVKGVQIGLEAGYIKTERIADDPATEGTKETDDGRKNLNANLSFMFSF